MHSFDRILLSAFEFDVHAVIKESRYTILYLLGPFIRGKIRRELSV